MSETPVVELNKDAQKILDLVEKLSVLDLANLVKAMEEKFGVSAAAPVAVAAAPASGGDASSASDAPSQVNVELTTSGAQKIAVIKVVREITGLGLKEAKDIVDGAPKVIKEAVKKVEADAMKSKLEAAGATVTFK
jgi:large subunit ribosomal protein L7/L12